MLACLESRDDLRRAVGLRHPRDSSAGGAAVREEDRESQAKSFQQPRRAIEQLRLHLGQLVIRSRRVLVRLLRVVCRAFTELLLADAFDFGQVYVALSRVTSLAGLWIRGGRVTQHVVKAHPAVLAFYRQIGCALGCLLDR